MVSSKDERKTFQQVVSPEKINRRKATTINSVDVICGRRKASFNHVGNERFRRKVKSSVRTYIQAESPCEKSVVLYSIVNSIHNAGGRFLKQDVVSGHWYELSDHQVRGKVAHAIRDAVKSQENRERKHKRNNAIGSPEWTFATNPFAHITKNQQQGMEQIQQGLAQPRHTSFLMSLTGTHSLPTYPSVGDKALNLPLSCKPGHVDLTAKRPMPRASVMTNRAAVNMECPLEQGPDITSHIVLAKEEQQQEDQYDEFLAKIDSVLGPLQDARAPVDGESSIERTILADDRAAIHASGNHPDLFNSYNPEHSWYSGTMDIF